MLMKVRRKKEFGVHPQQLDDVHLNRLCEDEDDDDDAKDDTDDDDDDNDDDEDDDAKDDTDNVKDDTDDDNGKDDTDEDDNDAKGDTDEGGYDDDENSKTGNSDEPGEENEEEKPYYFGMDVYVSEDDEDYVPKKEMERQQKQKPKNVETLRIKSPELSQTLPEVSSEVMSKARPM